MEWRSTKLSAGAVRWEYVLVWFKELHDQIKKNKTRTSQFGHRFLCSASRLDFKALLSFIFPRLSVLADCFVVRRPLIQVSRMASKSEVLSC